MLIKSVSESSFSAEGDLLHYSYLVYNNGSTSLAGPVTVSDDKSTDETCPAVSTVGDYDDNLDPGEGITRTATYTVLAGDVTAGFVTNSATATASGVNSNTDSVTVLKSDLPDLRVTKGNNVGGNVAVGISFNWTLLVTNPGLANATFASGQTILSDPLPAGHLWDIAANTGTRKLHEYHQLGQHQSFDRREPIAYLHRERRIGDDWQHER